MAWLSHAFGYDLDILQKPAVTFIALQVTAGLVYLGVLFGLASQQATKRNLLFAMLLVGLCMRLAMFGSVPILEDDYYRYLWDGAVTANAQNPYAWSADQITQHAQGVPHSLVELGANSNMVLQRINHPWLRTIYPPVAQAAFALGYWIKPFDIQGLRWVWLGVDILILAMLAHLVRHVPAKGFLLAIYWLNPLLIKEIYNSGHMELVLVLGMVLTIAAALRHAHTAAGFSLSLAVGAKLWPVLWLPLLLGQGVNRWKSRAAFTAAFVLPAAVLIWPVVNGHFDNNSGFRAYARYWQMNDSAYLLIHELANLVSHEHAWQIARLVAGGLVLLVMGWCLRYHKDRPASERLVNSLTAVTLALFLLSPTQFPWYFLWVLPLMVFVPLWSVLWFTVTLPLYYLRFTMDAHGQSWWYDYGVIWIEFVPIWLGLAWELYQRRHGRGCQISLFSEKT